MSIFKTKKIVRLSHTDAAGVLYFSRIFDLMHEAYEDLLLEKGISISELLKHDLYTFPIVSAHADYKRPIVVGDDLTFQLAPKARSTSFEIAYHIFRKTELVAEAHTVHVCLSKLTRRPVPIPDLLHDLFASNSR
ncbi:MAG: acyl-CoA thioesterase [Candidatus Hydrogenedentota bacterium]|nr:MAG: acyl-CoA thioesterase [Candidatus Hydrogenedentota bacterium]